MVQAPALKKKKHAFCSKITEGLKKKSKNRSDTVKGPYKIRYPTLTNETEEVDGCTEKKAMMQKNKNFIPTKLG